jgi:hypothetical protein
MGRMVRLLMLLLLATATLVHAQAVQPGAQVRFIEREQHIPAHPAPGDIRVSLPFVSGSTATVLRTDAATGWIEVQGQPLQGAATTGWVTPTYLASRPGPGEPASSPLALPGQYVHGVHRSYRRRPASSALGRLDLLPPHDVPSGGQSRLGQTLRPLPGGRRAGDSLMGIPWVKMSAVVAREER